MEKTLGPTDRAAYATWKSVAEAGGLLDAPIFMAEESLHRLMLKRPPYGYEGETMRKVKRFMANATRPGVRRFASCAVVGSSGELRRRPLGAEIDSHSAVIRANAAPVGGSSRWECRLSWWRHSSPPWPSGANSTLQDSWLRCALVPGRRAAHGPAEGCAAAVPVLQHEFSTSRRPPQQVHWHAHHVACLLLGVLERPLLTQLGSMVKVPPLAVPQLAPCASSGRACRLWAALYPQSEAQPLGAQPPPRGLERAASKVADFTAFDHVTV